MQYLVVSGKLSQSSGVQKVHFRSRSLDECYSFIHARLQSENLSAVREAYKFYVVDLMGVRQYSPIKKSA
jgi:hypothetical protein